jgi:hypothetical protein
MSQRQPCSSGKTQHRTAGDAQAEISSARRRNLGRGRGADHRSVGGAVKVKPFRCPECDFWHVGHEAKKGRR